MRFKTQISTLDSRQLEKQHVPLLFFMYLIWLGSQQRNALSFQLNSLYKVTPDRTLLCTNPIKMCLTQNPMRLWQTATTLFFRLQRCSTAKRHSQGNNLHTRTWVLTFWTPLPLEWTLIHLSLPKLIFPFLKTRKKEKKRRWFQTKSSTFKSHLLT